MSENWPFVRGSLKNTGATSASGPRTEPGVKWEHDVRARVFGTPIVVEERVYLTTCAQSHHSIDCAVAIDRESGEREWMSAPTGMEVRGTPAVVDGTMYFVDLDGCTYALDTADGTVRHETEPNGMTPADGLCPLVYDEMLFSNYYAIEARNVDSMGLRWKSDDDCIFEEPFAIADGVLFAGGTKGPGERVYVGQDDFGSPSYVITADPVVRAVDAETGIVHWEVSVGGSPRAPAVVDETVFVATDGSEPQGKRVSTVKANSDEQPIPGEEPAEYRTFGTVHALDAATGTEQWSTELDDRVRSMPAVDGQYVCVGTTDGQLVCLDAKTGEKLWSRRVNEDYTVNSSPTIADDTVYVGSDDEYLLAVDLHSGEELWCFPTESAVDSNPAVVDGVVYFADNSGNVYALE